MTFLAIEIGGTKLQAALGDGAGTIHARKRIRAFPEAGRSGICKQIASLITELLGESNTARETVEQVGIGFGGPVDAAAGRVVKSHQVAGWEDFPLVDWLREESGLDAVLANDSDMAGLAEAHFGAGRGEPLVVYMNIGSGIGGAIVQRGVLYAGQGSGACEIGHLRILPGAKGGPWRTLESLCSGWSLAEAARSAADHAPESLLRSMVVDDREKIATTLPSYMRYRQLITAEMLVEAVRRNDPTAKAVWHRAVELLAVAIANVTTLLNPSCFVLGGGVAQCGELLFDPLRRAVGHQVFEPFAETFRLVPAALGEDVVLHGALKLARDASRVQGTD